MVTAKEAEEVRKLAKEAKSGQDGSDDVTALRWWKCRDRQKWRDPS